MVEGKEKKSGWWRGHVRACSGSVSRDAHSELPSCGKTATDREKPRTKEGLRMATTQNRSSNFEQKILKIVGSERGVSGFGGLLRTLHSIGGVQYEL